MQQWQMFIIIELLVSITSATNCECVRVSMRFCCAVGGALYATVCGCVTVWCTAIVVFGPRAIANPDGGCCIDNINERSLIWVYVCVHVLRSSDFDH